MLKIPLPKIETLSQFDEEGVWSLARHYWYSPRITSRSFPEIHERLRSVPGRRLYLARVMVIPGNFLPFRGARIDRNTPRRLFILDAILGLPGRILYTFRVQKVRSEESQDQTSFLATGRWYGAEGTAPYLETHYEFLHCRLPISDWWGAKMVKFNQNMSADTAQK